MWAPCQPSLVPQSDILHAYATLPVPFDANSTSPSAAPPASTTTSASSSSTPPCAAVCDREILELESPMHAHVHMNAAARACKACLHKVTVTQVVQHHTTPADAAYRAQLRRRAVCWRDPRRTKDPPVTRVGYAAYMAAAVNRSCLRGLSRLSAAGGVAYSGLRGLLASSVFKRGAGGGVTIDETALPNAWRARVRALCVGGKTEGQHKGASIKANKARGGGPTVVREWAGRGGRKAMGGRGRAAI